MSNYRVLTVSDLHQRASLYTQLAVAVAQHKPDLVALVGDFLDGETPLPPGCLTAEAAADALTSLPCPCVFSRGNHDMEEWTAFEVRWDKYDKPLNALHCSAATFGPLTVVGFPCGLGEDEYYATGRETEGGSWWPEDWLAPLLRKTGPAGRSLWLIHEPPTMALAAHVAYEPLWGDAVSDYQPAVVVSGHDHTTPLRTGRWRARIGRSFCICAGQHVYPRASELVYCVLDFGFDEGGRGYPKSVKARRFGA